MSLINQCPDDSALLPTGDSGCPQDLTAARKIFLYKEGVNYATIDSAKTEADLDTLIQSEDVIVLKLVEQTDNSDKEEEIWEGNGGGTHKIADGVSKNTYNLINTPALHAFLRTYDQFSGGYVVVDRNKNTRMHTANGITVDPISIGRMSVGIQTSANDGNPAFTPITIEDKFPREWNNNPVSFKPSWNILGKNGLLPVRVSVVSASATEIVVNATNYETGAPVVGLEAADGADWVLLTAAGAAQVITTSTESGTILGQYALAGSAFVTGTLTLADPDTLGVPGYKAANTDIVTVT
jgi:hypothetical protein